MSGLRAISAQVNVRNNHTDTHTHSHTHTHTHTQNLNTIVLFSQNSLEWSSETYRNNGSFVTKNDLSIKTTSGTEKERTK